MTLRDRLDELALRGVHIFIDSETGKLKARCEPEFTRVLATARPMLQRHKAAIIAELQRANCYPCIQCERPLFSVPGITCFWCRQTASIPVIVS